MIAVHQVLTLPPRPTFFPKSSLFASSLLQPICKKLSRKTLHNKNVALIKETGDFCFKVFFFPVLVNETDFEVVLWFTGNITTPYILHVNHTCCNVTPLLSSAKSICESFVVCWQCQPKSWCQWFTLVA